MNVTPFVFKRSTLFSFDSQTSATSAVRSGILTRFDETGGDLPVQLCRGRSEREALPPGFAKLFRWHDLIRSDAKRDLGELVVGLTGGDQGDAAQL